MRKFYVDSGIEAEARIRDLYEVGVDDVMFRDSLKAAKWLTSRERDAVDNRIQQMNIPLLAGIAMVMFSSYMLRYALINYRKALASQTWPSVRGELVEVQLWGKRNINGEMKDAENLKVKYEYSVQDTSHVGTSTAFFTLMYPDTIDFATKHPNRSPIEVYYDPHNPSESVLIPGPRESKRFSGLLLGFFGIVAGAVVAALGWAGVLG